jgi:hypothetical protein
MEPFQEITLPKEVTDGRFTEVMETQPWNEKIPTVEVDRRSTFSNFLRPLRLLRFKSKGMDGKG